MLVLGRKANERLIIDGRIIITVVRVSGSQVRLGIEAPADVAIQREELLWQAADHEGARSAAARLPDWPGTVAVRETASSWSP